MAKAGQDQHLKLSPQSLILLQKSFLTRNTISPPRRISVAWNLGLKDVPPAEREVVDTVTIYLWIIYSKGRVSCFIWDKVFKNGPSDICGRQPLKNLKSRPYHFRFLKAVFHKFYLVHSWILCPIYGAMA